MGDEREQAWFDDAGLGLFVHWDHASQQGLELSWPLVGGTWALADMRTVSPDEYHASAATFDPVRWDPAAFARMARELGARYAVFTAKHHSGWCAWPSRHGGFTIASSPCGGDLVRGFVDAVRAEGLRVGLYLSLPDWHHPDYPPFTLEHRPYVAGPPPPPAEVWERFHADLRGQLEELLTGYGQIDVLWFDGGWERSAARWRSDELEALIRRLQPGILINDRLPGVGDYDTPEQAIPARPPARRWETCMTMNESWGWVPDDHDWKSATSLVHALCEVRGRGGNLLLNVSPTGDGSLPAEQVERLEVLRGWVERNGEAIHGARPALEPWQHHGPATRRGDVLYVHCLARPYEAVTVRGIPVRRVRSARAVGTGADLAFRTRTTILDRRAPDPLGEVVVEVPEEHVDPVATVIALVVEGWGGEAHSG